ncbi:MAG TPA: ribonuclease III [Bryobacteraceae bacterium]|nr:ribonuclease III [Bryobacteraceae bacterium]
MSAELRALEDVIGHRFKRPELLERALTHRSSVYEKNSAGAFSDNEQLEFLGDSILGFVVSDMLLERRPDFPEGQLSKLKAHLVSASHLHEAALKIGLGNHLRLGRGEELSGGREKKALLANALEAVIAAVYLDAGMDTAREFVAREIVGNGEVADGGMPVIDYKSALQERAQALKLPQPRYSIVEERGPEHAKTFLVEVRVGRQLSSRAEGLSKKSASQKAAQHVLEQLNEH